LARRNEEEMILALQEELAYAQRIDVRILSEDGMMHRTVLGAAGRVSLYADPERLDRLIAELERQVKAHLAAAGNKGRLLGKAKLNEFLERSERWERTERAKAAVEKMSERQAGRRLDVALRELRKEGNVLKSDVDIFRRNARIAGMNNRESLRQLVNVTKSKAGPAVEFAKRAKIVARNAVRRERAQAEIDAYREEFPDDAEFQWITVSARPCPDCQQLAGSVKKFSEWRAMNLTPGSGSTICGQACRCKLMPLIVADRMFPTVKEFKWDERKAVLLRPSQMRRVKAGRQ
jgi:translation initiation factor 2 beta subunit (eIF-2beta)/eIF-5